MTVKTKLDVLRTAWLDAVAIAKIDTDTIQNISDKITNVEVEFIESLMAIASDENISSSMRVEIYRHMKDVEKSISDARGSLMIEQLAQRK